MYYSFYSIQNYGLYRSCAITIQLDSLTFKKYLRKKMYTINNKEYPCPASVTMGIIGGKWKVVMLFHLIKGPLRYNELRKKMDGVTERTLSIQLKSMEDDGMISRKAYNTKPPLKVEYSLTEYGKTLIPLINSIVGWGNFVIDKHAEEQYDKKCIEDVEL